jgi:hypothetical protein
VKLPELTLRSMVIGWFASSVLLPSIVCAQTDLEQRRQRLESLSPSEKRDLLAKKDRFDRLSDDEKTHLRALDSQIHRHPNSDQLLHVLKRYGQWLATLSPTDRAALQSLGPEERIKRIQELRSQEHDLRLSGLGLSKMDADVIVDWWNRFVASNEKLVVEQLDKSDRQAYSRMGPESPNRTMFLRFSVWRSMDDLLKKVPRGDITQLVDRLSDPARKRYVGLNPDEQTELLEKWLKESLRYHMRPPAPSEDELIKMAERLPPEEREKLERLPRDEFLQALRGRWDSQQMWRRSRGFRRGHDKSRGEAERFRGDRPPKFPGPPLKDRAEPPDGVRPPPLEER